MISKNMFLPPHYQDDHVDRLSRLYTVTLLMILAIVAAMRQAFGQTLVCFCPAYFPTQSCDYAQSICWSNKEYDLRNNSDTLNFNISPSTNYLSWIPFILLFHALLAYLPSLPWKIVGKKISDMDMGCIMDAGRRRQQSVSEEERRKIACYIARHISTTKVTDLPLIVIGFLGTKLLYLLSAILQLIVLDFFLNYHYRLYGLRVLFQLMLRREWDSAENLPRTIMCNFNISISGTIHRHRIQCSSDISQFYEKIFLLIWVWIFALIFIIISNGLLWTARLLNISGHRQHLRKQLESSGVSVSQLGDVQTFSKTCVGSDGILALDLIAENFGDMLAAEVILEMWKSFISNKECTKDTQVIRGQYAGQGGAEMEGLRERTTNKDLA